MTMHIDKSMVVILNGSTNFNEPELVLIHLIKDMIITMPKTEKSESKKQGAKNVSFSEILNGSS